MSDAFVGEDDAVDDVELLFAPTIFVVVATDVGCVVVIGIAVVDSDFLTTISFGLHDDDVAEDNSKSDAFITVDGASGICCNGF